MEMRLLTSQLANLKPRLFKRGNSLPSPPESLWRIERGIVRCLTWTEAGTLKALEYWGPGDVVGQPLSQISPYQMECSTSVEASLVPTYLWNHLLDAIVVHVQQTEELLSILHQDRVPLRLLQLLCWLAQKFGRPVEQGQLIDLRLTHQEIADFVRTTRVTATRLLKQLEQEGRIRRLRHHIVLCHHQLQLG